MTLVEWPERAAAAPCPPDRLEIALIFDPADGPEFRRAEIRAFGAIGVALAARARDRAAVAARRLGARRERVPLARRRLDPRLSSG